MMARGLALRIIRSRLVLQADYPVVFGVVGVVAIGLRLLLLLLLDKLEAFITDAVFFLVL